MPSKEAVVLSEVAKVAHAVEIVETAGTVEHMDTAAAAALDHLLHGVLVPFFHVLEGTSVSVEATVSAAVAMGLFAAVGEVHTVHKDNCPIAAYRLIVSPAVLVGCPASHHEHKTDP